MKNTYFSLAMCLMFCCVLQGMDNDDKVEYTKKKRKSNPPSKLQKMDSARNVLQSIKKREKRKSAPLNKIKSASGSTQDKKPRLEQQDTIQALRQLRLLVEQEKSESIEEFLQENSHLGSRLLFHTAQRYIKVLEQLNKSQATLSILVRHTASEINLNPDHQNKILKLVKQSNCDAVHKDPFLQFLLVFSQPKIQPTDQPKKDLKLNRSSKNLQQKTSYSLNQTEKAFFKSASECDVTTFTTLLPQIHDINLQDPKTGDTVLMKVVQGICKSEKKGPISDWGPIFSTLIKDKTIDIGKANWKGETATSIAERYEGEKANIIRVALAKLTAINSVLSQLEPNDQI